MNKILVVDDDAELVLVYHKKLAGEGFEVKEALNGEAGLALALKEHPDLILSDINMPKMDGIAMIKKLREDTWGKNVPIIVISSMDTNDERLRAVSAAEPAFYLLKPDHTLDDVIARIREVLAKPKR